MRISANCKLNLHLRVTGKLPDGYHSLETIFQEIPFCDELEIDAADDGTVHFSASGIPIPENGNNICVKAAKILKEKFSITKGCRIHLRKNVPIGAGLGGGSSDAAAVLKALNGLWELRLKDSELEHIGLLLGADVPFFIKGGCAWAEGKGEILTQIPPVLKNGTVLLVYPNIHVSTPWAYKNLNLNLTKTTGSVIFAEVSKPGFDLNGSRAGFTNDFESAVFAEYPEIGRIKEILLKEGAELTAMSGSGSTVFGFFNTSGKLFNSLKFLDDKYFVKAINV